MQETPNGTIPQDKWEKAFSKTEAGTETEAEFYGIEHCLQCMYQHEDVDCDECQECSIEREE